MQLGLAQTDIFVMIKANVIDTVFVVIHEYWFGFLDIILLEHVSIITTRYIQRILT